MKVAHLACKVSENEIVTTISDKCKSHQSISIKNQFPATAELNISAATVDQINKIIKSLDGNKLTEPGKILVKVVKMLANIIDKHLSNMMSHDLLRK